MSAATTRRRRCSAVLVKVEGPRVEGPRVARRGLGTRGDSAWRTKRGPRHHMSTRKSRHTRVDTKQRASGRAHQAQVDGRMGRPREGQGHVGKARAPHGGRETLCVGRVCVLGRAVVELQRPTAVFKV